MTHHQPDVASLTKPFASCCSAISSACAHSSQRWAAFQEGCCKRWYQKPYNNPENYICHLPSTNQAGDLMVGGYQTSEMGLSLCELVLCLITALAFKRPSVESSLIFSIVLPESEVRLAGLELPGSSLTPSLHIGQLLF